MLTVADGEGNAKEVIWWDGASWPVPTGRFDLAYVVRASTYRGQTGVQVVWREARPVAETEVAVHAPTIQVVDCRQRADPLSALRLAGRGGCRRVA